MDTVHEAKRFPVISVHVGGVADGRLGRGAVLLHVDRLRLVVLPQVLSPLAVCRHVFFVRPKCTTQ